MVTLLFITYRNSFDKKNGIRNGFNKITIFEDADVENEDGKISPPANYTYICQRLNKIFGQLIFELIATGYFLTYY